MSEQNKVRTLFIINPNSGFKLTSQLIRGLMMSYPSVDYVLTKYAGHLTEIVKEKFNDYEVFVAAGGDGTVNELARAIENTEKIMAVFPLGSGNGFARELGFKFNLQWIINDIRKFNVIRIDTIKINNYTSINLSGVGLDSHIAHAFHLMPWRGIGSYVISAIKAIMPFKALEVTIKTNGNIYNDKYILVSIANTRQFGNNAIVAPMAKPDDGRYEILMVKPFPHYLYPIYLIKMFGGSIKPNKYINFLMCNGETIIETESREFHIDGEPVLLESPIKVTINKSSVLVIQTKRMRKKQISDIA